jgi:predicted metal-dependent phosphoesterase TrpH
MERYVDLHCHSTASDGTLAPADVVRLAKTSGLVGLALTDHDTVAGVAEAAAQAKKLGIEFVSGIEVSCTYRHPGTMHLLGYGVDVQSAVLKELMRGLIEARDTRNPRIIAKLNELGVAISMNEVEQQADGEVIGRPHIASVLVKKGYVSSIKQAFDKFLGQGAAAYFEKERLTPRQAIELIRNSGGLAVLAHPVQLCTGNDAELERVAKDLVDMGLAGIEVIHSDHDPALMEKYSRLAGRFKLLKTGGSDFHGGNKDVQLGWARGRRVPGEMMESLVQRIGAGADGLQGRGFSRPS